MGWNRDTRKKAGGYWRCRVVRKTHDALYSASEKGKARHARHNALPHRRLAQRLYDMTSRVRVRY